MIYQLSHELIFSDPFEADESGLLALGGDLNVDRLLLAYSQGIFPWFNPEDPIMWWSPAWRPIFIPGEMKVSKSLRRTIKKGVFEIRMDTAFEQVMRACGDLRKDEEGTWISEDMIESYTLLHEMGYAHSVEAWQDNQLVGGLYGVALGRAFFGESMFHKVSDASKVAFFALSENLKEWGFKFIDSQVSNPHLESLGSMEIHRTVFMDMLAQAVVLPTKVGRWENAFGDLASRL
jgi:leucyl/phenylalanyl-tRNA--protein transferase